MIEVMAKQKPQTRLRELRLRRGLSCEALAEILGCSAASVSAIELGNRTPGLSLAFAIERFAGINSEEWVRRAG
jgi:transcriptional regulator with XRE-family HTH domain